MLVQVNRTNGEMVTVTSADQLVSLLNSDGVGIWVDGQSVGYGGRTPYTVDLSIDLPTGRVGVLDLLPAKQPASLMPLVAAAAVVFLLFRMER